MFGALRIKKSILGIGKKNFLKGSYNNKTWQTYNSHERSIIRFFSYQKMYLV